MYNPALVADKCSLIKFKIRTMCSQLQVVIQSQESSIHPSLHSLFLLAISSASMPFPPHRILTEDKAMVENLEPEMLGREISVKADMPQMAFRKLRQQYIDLGYGVAPETKPILPPKRDM